MEKGSKSNINKLYREFSKQKFNTYRLKYPKLKESQITKKVLKEWEELDDKERKTLEETLRKKNISTEQDAVGRVGGKKPKKKGADANIDEAPAIVALEPVKGGQKTPPKLPVDESSGDQQEAKSLKASESGHSSGSSISKTKRIRKVNISQLRNGEYLQFFKFYYERLAKEHPRWTPNGRTSVIKLLWKKRQIQKRKETISKRLVKVPTARIKKPVYLTGYTFFAKQKIQNHPDVEPSQVKKQSAAAWKKLNRAGKLFYENKARLHNAILPPLEEQRRPKKTIQFTALLQLTI